MGGKLILVLESILLLYSVLRPQGVYLTPGLADKYQMLKDLSICILLGLFFVLLFPENLENCKLHKLNILKTDYIHDVHVR